MSPQESAVSGSRQSFSTPAPMWRAVSDPSPVPNNSSLPSADQPALAAKADQRRETQVPWSQSLRTVVRNNPLASLAGALVVGALIARVVR